MKVPGKHPVVFLISAPSGAGKTSLSSKLLESEPDLTYSVSCTTRPPREGEVNGVHYHFLSREAFEAKIAAGEFLEYADVYGNYYGTLVATVEDLLKAGKTVLIDVDVQGQEKIETALNERPENDLLRRAYVDVFIAPPSVKELRRRLEGRASDSPEVIERRMDNADAEMAALPRFDYCVVNDDFDEAFAELRAILHASACRVPMERGL